MGLRITQDTSAPMQLARVNCQVTAALVMRAMCRPRAGARAAAMGLLESLLLFSVFEVLRIVRTIVCREGPVRISCASANLLKAPAAAIHTLGRPPSSPKQKAEIPCEPRHRTQPKETWKSSYSRCDLTRGTKRALLGGGGAFDGFMSQCRYDPRLELPGGAWILAALILE